MKTQNNWITSNLSGRFTNPGLDFEIKVTPTKFKYMSFEDAVIHTSKTIINTYDNLYLSYSGGLDSEFTLFLFHQLKIPITPIIVTFSGNELESSYAFHMCNRLNIKPVVLECTDAAYFEIYRSIIYEKMNGRGKRSVPNIIVQKYVDKNKGTMLTGDHLISDLIVVNVEASEWDFYIHTLYPETPCIGLLAYTPEIVYATAKLYDGSNTQEFKSRIFGLDFRPKIKHHLNSYITDNIKKLKTHIDMPKRVYTLGNKDKFLSIMESWNV